MNRSLAPLPPSIATEKHSSGGHRKRPQKKATEKHRRTQKEGFLFFSVFICVLLWLFLIVLLWLLNSVLLWLLTIEHRLRLGIRRHAFKSLCEHQTIVRVDRPGLHELLLCARELLAQRRMIPLRLAVERAAGHVHAVVLAVDLEVPLPSRLVERHTFGCGFDRDFHWYLMKNRQRCLRRDFLRHQGR